MIWNLLQQVATIPVNIMSASVVVWVVLLLYNNAAVHADWFYKCTALPGNSPWRNEKKADAVLTVMEEVTQPLLS